MQLNLPNQLTLARLGLCALFVVALSLSDEIFAYGGTTALAIFVVASLTDWLDGWIARRHHLITDLGKLLDPLADKILISAAFVGLMEYGYASMWMVIVIISREFLITGLRVVALNRGFVLAAERAGKHKTISQIVVIIVSLVLISAGELEIRDGILFDWLDQAQTPLMWVALLITVASGAIYFYRNRALFTDPEPLAPPRVSPLLTTDLVATEPPPVLPAPVPKFPAFKEWQTIVEALGQGEQAIILRKGGIAEGRSGFSVRHRAFWLFPTRFHQQIEKVKPAARAFLRESGRDGAPVQLQYFAEVTQIGYLQDWEQVPRLDRFHFWPEEVLRERFDYGAEPGLHCILVRVHRLEKPLELAWQKTFDGCKSWIELEEDWTQFVSHPVITEENYHRLREEILQAVNLPG